MQVLAVDQARRVLFTVMYFEPLVVDSAVLGYCCMVVPCAGHWTTDGGRNRLRLVSWLKRLRYYRGSGGRGGLGQRWFLRRFQSRQARRIGHLSCPPSRPPTPFPLLVAWNEST